MFCWPGKMVCKLFTQCNKNDSRAELRDAERARIEQAPSGNVAELNELLFNFVAVVIEYHIQETTQNKNYSLE